MNTSDHVKKYRAPGRINLIGEHTDYNDGFVLPAAIDKEIVFEISAHEDPNICEVYAKNPDEHFVFHLTDYEPMAGGWQNYVMGVVSELQKLSHKVRGFKASFEGNIPLGGGMSSSAALECGLAYGLNDFFNLALDQWHIIKASQMAEHHFVGMKCGIMDQFSSIMGKADHAMLLDCRSLDFEYFPLDLQDYELILLDTNVAHELATSAYNTRREECEAGVDVLKQAHPAILALRDVSLEDLADAAQEMDPVVYKRCHHVVSENARVQHAASSLRVGDLRTLGKLMFDSHQSLKDDYEVSCGELDFLVALARENQQVLGSRMMGGGFGGCTINLVHQSATDRLIDEASAAYRNRFGINLNHYLVHTADGASQF